MSHPLLRQQDAPQIGMPVKPNSEHVKNFALEPVCYRPDGNYRARLLVFAEMRFQTQPLVLREGIEIRDEIESLLALRPIHRGEVCQIIEFLVIAAIFRNIEPLRSRDENDGLLAI